MKGHYLHVRNVLVAALKDEYNKVIALKGKWGTGKTFLWDEIKREIYSGDNKPIYVSLFGAKTLSDLKLRILQNSFSSDKKSFSKINKAAESILSTGFSAVKHLFGISAEDTALIGLPLLVSNKLVVIDDVERKHLDLDVDELLGFLDEYSEIYKVRFLIVLNTDKLIDVEMWHTLHEKVIDFEVTLKPTPAESFDAAFKSDSWVYKEEVCSAISILGVNNIRVIERILRVVKYVHENQIDSDISAKNWVPSCALLTACYFKALDNPPSFEFIHSYNSVSRHFKDENEIFDPNEAIWGDTLDKLGIFGADDFELILHEYLKTGILDHARLAELFTTYKLDISNSFLYSKVVDFYKVYFWDPMLSDHDILLMARDFLSDVDKLGADQISNIVNIVDGLGDKALVRSMLDKWLISADSRPEYQQIGNYYFNSSRDKLHPEVEGKLKSLRDKQAPPLTLLDAVRSILDDTILGDREREALRGSTIEQYEDLLKKVRRDELRSVISLHVNWIRDKNSDKAFDSCERNFISACKKILLDPSCSRLASVVGREFKSNGLIELLQPEGA